MFESTDSKKLIVYGRMDCHLCQEMIASLQKLQGQIEFEFEMIDIDSDPELVSQYNERIPVLVSVTGKQEEICHYYLDTAALDAYFAKIR
ncbi:glutaredoxin family protein [Nitrosomonas communis]|uniref:glutaredoxin family protein n=1 Tax=Nitrosomonas communis TaxID=44574 RepID=UPI0026EA6771|nr:glutaredoxin family protein [Nitrosomonas communis]MCO6426527.1 glutaredoxin family protein [Nitrosomonas communis]